MTVKSNIVFDHRIRDISNIQSIYFYNDEFIGCKGYFFNDIISAQNLRSMCEYGELAEIDDNCHSDLCFRGKFELDEGGGRSFFRFFIPESLLRAVEKEYRPYKSVQEFFDDVGCTLGDRIHLKLKSVDTDYYTMITGYTGNEKVSLGDGGYYSLSDLFITFEIYTSDGCKPFGIEEKYEARQ